MEKRFFFSYIINLCKIEIEDFSSSLESIHILLSMDQTSKNICNQILHNETKKKTLFSAINDLSSSKSRSFNIPSCLSERNKNLNDENSIEMTKSLGMKKGKLNISFQKMYEEKEALIKENKLLKVKLNDYEQKHEVLLNVISLLREENENIIKSFQKHKEKSLNPNFSQTNKVGKYFDDNAQEFSLTSKDEIIKEGFKIINSSNPQGLKIFTTKHDVILGDDCFNIKSIKQEILNISDLEINNLEVEIKPSKGN